MPRVESLLGMMGETGAWSPVWIGIYKANALTLDDYRHGRVLFAGDAAHLLPIFGVRGANSGIDDADNLAWKLAFVVKGIASARLVDSYSAERVAAARENLGYGTKSTEFMAPPSFAFELMRKAVLGLAVKFPELRSLINPRQSSAIAYTHSPLNVTAQETEFRAGPAPGQVLTECPLAIVDGASTRNGHLTDLIGPTITALYFSDDGAVPDELTKCDAAMRARGIPFAIVAVARRAGAAQTRGGDSSGQLFAMYDAAPGTLYLVRPDGHVIGRWRRFDAVALTEAIDHLLQP
jgi:3-(3-hydroxy-phenyl)propionate hydroxylase